MLFFYRSILTQLFLNVYFIYRVEKCRRINTFLKYLLYSVIACETLIFFTGIVSREYLPLEYYTLIQTISAYWTVSSLYFAVFLSVFDLLFFLNGKWVFYIRFRQIALLSIDTILLALFLLYINAHFQSSSDRYLEPQIKKYAFHFDAANDTLETPTNYKLLVVSDLHLGYLIDKTVLQKYVTVMNAQQADLIVIAGDLVDYYLEPLEKQQMDSELKKLSAPLGIYFVPGNHEYKINAEACFEWIRNAGIQVLRDSVVTIGNRFQLIGRDDRKNKDHRMEWESLLAKTDAAMPRILVSHQPGDIEDGVASNIPLIICGHTHQGQIFPVNLLGYLLYSNLYGLKKEGNSASYTTSGLGLSGFPFRIGSKSEMVIFTVEFDRCR
ncbi:MAG: metallophosphoesterase [Dysgonamonadaceae bacterium]|jgi:predicted MPP superfamily phosphohydrolase|nr:metallophosphoesterase [Dysgonamonadaceae bacterium]